MTTNLGYDKRVNVIQGEYRVTRDPAVVFTTLLGSSIAACIRDPIARVGGMNHFLVPGTEKGDDRSNVDRYGVHLMELLVNGLMRSGAQRDRLEAKLFGGARMLRGLSDIGQKNAEFARNFLQHEGIPIVGDDLGGERGRRLQYWPVSGRARRSYVAGAPTIAESAAKLPVIDSGKAELFFPRGN